MIPTTSSQCAPHNLQGVVRDLVGGYLVGTVSQDRHRDCLKVPRVPDLVLHPVAEGMTNDLQSGERQARPKQVSEPIRIYSFVAYF